MFAFVMLNVATVMSLKGIPLLAATGATMVFYLLFSTVFFLVPCALVAAELSTSWSKPGGVYLWVKSALGTRFGVIAVWLQWIQNIIWVPTALAFAADSFAYSLNAPDLAKSGTYTALMIMSVYWIAILITLRGLKLSSTITTIGVIIGTILPGVLVIVLGTEWLITGSPGNIVINIDTVFPDLSHFSNISFMAGIVLLFAGMEVNAVHINDLENPTSQYPKAILLSVVIIVAIFSLGAASLALILPKDDISLTAGIMQAFHFVLAQYNLLWLVEILGAFIAFGVVAAIIAWICGPSRGLLVAAENGEIPQFLAYKNKNDVQSNILIMQGIIVTVLASLHLLIKNIDEVYFLLTVMAVTLYLLMYFLMFISALKLRYTMPDIQRKYKVPGGIAGIWLVCVVGILSVVFALVCGFFPPEQLGIGSPELYLGIIITGVVVFVLIPIFMTSPKKTVPNKTS